MERNSTGTFNNKAMMVVMSERNFYKLHGMINGTLELSKHPDWFVIQTDTDTDSEIIYLIFFLDSLQVRARFSKQNLRDHSARILWPNAFPAAQPTNSINAVNKHKHDEIQKGSRKFHRVQKHGSPPK